MVIHRYMMPWCVWLKICQSDISLLMVKETLVQLMVIVQRLCVILKPKWAKLAVELLRDIDKETVDFVPNFDESETEPSVLPSKYPNLLVNGSSGIAVGMATNIPPHNLGEIIDGTVAFIDNPEITIDELMKYIKGPDFPTAGIILGKSGIKSAYRTGRGRIKVRGKVDVGPQQKREKTNCHHRNSLHG